MFLFNSSLQSSGNSILDWQIFIFFSKANELATKEAPFKKYCSAVTPSSYSTQLKYNFL